MTRKYKTFREIYFQPGVKSYLNSHKMNYADNTCQYKRSFQDAYCTLNFEVFLKLKCN